MSYAEKLKDPRWQKKRLKILERDGWSCRHCGKSIHQLHVHHLVYGKNCDPWDYHDSILVSLCGDCHEHFEKLRESVLAWLGMDLHKLNIVLIRLHKCGLERADIIRRLETWATAYEKFCGKHK
jgi:hypothetical protein